jgi:hypothetical protein
MRAPILFLAPLLAGCMSIPTHSLDDWRGAQSRHFDHTTPKQFETALARVFDASHPGEYQLRPLPDGVLAERRWLIYVVIGAASGDEQWHVSYAPAAAGIDARADLVNIPGGGWPPNMNGAERPDNPATYELLWSRLDYVLGNRAGWPGCDDYARPLAHHSIDQGQGWGLCGGDWSAKPALRISDSH